MAAACGLMVAIQFGACGATEPRPAAPMTAVQPAGHPRFPIVPMRLVAMDGARSAVARANLELRAEGTLHVAGAPVGRIAGARILDQDDREVFAVGPEASAVTVRRRRRRVRVTDEGALLFDESERVYFDELGRVVIARPGRPPEWMYLRMEALRPDALGTGALMVLFSMMRTN